MDTAEFLFCLGVLTGAAVWLWICDRTALSPNRDERVERFQNVLGGGLIIVETGTATLNPACSFNCKPADPEINNLPMVSLPQGINAEVIGSEVMLDDPLGNVLIIGENDLGGYGFKIPHEMQWHGNYATLQDAVRAAAYDGFTPGQKKS